MDHTMYDWVRELGRRYCAAVRRRYPDLPVELAWRVADRACAREVTFIGLAAQAGQVQLAKSAPRDRMWNRITLAYPVVLDEVLAKRRFGRGQRRLEHPRPALRSRHHP
jgi:hypothetical protein